MKILVTGGAGFIGVNTAKGLLEAGHDIVVVDNCSRLGAEENLAWLEEHGTVAIHRTDIRHCVADISRAQEVLNFEPRVSLADGIADLAAWVREQEAEDRVEHAAREFDEKGLTL